MSNNPFRISTLDSRRNDAGVKFLNNLAFRFIAAPMPLSRV